MIVGNCAPSLDRESSATIASTEIDRSIGETQRAISMKEADIDEDETEANERSNLSSVSFSTIEIKEYPIIAGDNPSVTIGVPITIAWTPVETRRCTVDDYEERRQSPRSMVELRMPSSYRVDLLQRLGFTRDEILLGTKAANITRNRRRRTSETMTLAPAQEAFERMKRAVMNATVRRMAKKRERRILRNFLPTHAKGSCVDDGDDSCSNLTACNSESSSLLIMKQ